jgi:hypothetical protein
MRILLSYLLAGSSLFVALEDIKDDATRQVAIVCWDKDCKKYVVSKPATPAQIDAIIEDNAK